MPACCRPRRRSCSISAAATGKDFGSVYVRGKAYGTVVERRDNIRAIIQAVFRVHVMIDTILGKVVSPVSFSIFASGGAPHDAPIYSTMAPAAGTMPTPQAELTHGLRLAAPLSFGDTQWTLLVTPGRLKLPTGGHECSTIVLICGLLLSAGLALFFWTLRHHARDFESSHSQVQRRNS